MRPRLRKAWRASSYFLVGAATAMLAWLFASGLLLVIGLALIVVGLPLLPEAVLLLRRFAGMERRRAGRVLGETIPERYVPLTGSLWQRVGRVARDPNTYRDVAWLLVHGLVGLFGGMLVLSYVLSVPLLLSVPFWWWAIAPDGPRLDITLTPQPFPLSEDHGLVVNNIAIDSWTKALTLPPLFACVYAVGLVLLVPWLARAYARLSRWILSPSARSQLAERVEELTETRAGALDAHAAELRRIERDLHDGTQARLVTIAMRLGLVEKDMTENPDKAARLLREALEGTEAAMTELRQVVRSIYPPILSDRGLDGAVSALISASPVRVTTEMSADGKLPAAVEAAAYFVIAEALTNIAKHSNASNASVRVHRKADTLHILVGDDGRGGADEAGTGTGTGLAGIRRRVAAFDGTFRLSSPAGGPTELRVELPCGS